jgi:3-dehydroquinate dehydratase-2
LARVFVLNGVNLGALGTRRPEVYGVLSLEDIEERLRERFPEVEFEFRQTDHEGEMVGYILVFLQLAILLLRCRFRGGRNNRP